MICSKSNYKLSRNWYEANKDFFMENYKKIGIKEEQYIKNMKMLEKGKPLKKKEEKKQKIRKISLLKKKEDIEKVKPVKEKKEKLTIVQHSVNLFKFYAFKKANVKSVCVSFDVKIF